MVAIQDAQKSHCTWQGLEQGHCGKHRRVFTGLVLALAHTSAATYLSLRQRGCR